MTHRFQHRMPRPQARSIAPLAPLLSLLLSLTSCSAGHDTSPDVGVVELALRNVTESSVYELRGASFQVSGETSLTLDAADAGEAALLVAELPVGSYQVELLPGWTLVQLDAGAAVELEATLTSDNPQPFDIGSAQTTLVRFAFEVDGERIGMDGQLELGFDVTRRVQRSVLFTELMSNPGELADSAGEWLELHNAGSDPVNLSGCRVRRDSSEFSIDTSLELAPGQSVALANSASPGFAPAFTYSSVTLPNSAVFVLTLTCGTELMDSISVDPSTWPGGAGISASLSAGAHTPSANDNPANWCDGATPYNTDLGTPGAANPSCP